MDTKAATRLLMLGAAPETRGSIAAVVDAYRAHGLFKRWPIDYLATHCDGSLAKRIAHAMKALRQFAVALVQHRRVAVHLHTGSGAGFWRDAVFAAAAIAARCPLILQPHGTGMAAGVPVVAAAVGGIPEVVVDGVSGYLVAPGDTATLSRLLRKLLLDRPLGERVGAAARESARLRFAPERALPPLEDLYASLGLGGADEPGRPLRDVGLRKAA